MTDERVDIVVPVWNRPVETRACLVAIVEHTPNARLVIVDNSSDRETERMLEEFAEALDEKVLLFRNPANEGFIKALNHGLGKAESRHLALVRYNTVVTAGWLEPMLALAGECPDAGIIVPSLTGSARSGKRLCRGMEMPLGDFAAMLLNKRLVEAVGGFKEDSDGAVWCLKEYSRRAMRAGYRTCVVPESVVAASEEPKLGSLTRRAELERRVSEEYRAVWGSERGYCIHIPKDAGMESFPERLGIMLACARQGNMVSVLLHPRQSRALNVADVAKLHLNLGIRTLPRFMQSRAMKDEIAHLADFASPVQLVAWSEDGRLPGWDEAILFPEFERTVRLVEQEVYGCGLRKGRLEQGGI